MGGAAGAELMMSCHWQTTFAHKRRQYVQTKHVASVREEAYQANPYASAPPRAIVTT
jgi:hypothetical protein